MKELSGIKLQTINDVAELGAFKKKGLSVS
jgi:hypothetical protein